MRVLIGLALVRCIGIGLVAGRLIRGARPAARGLARDQPGRVRVERLLGRLRVRVGTLLRLADLDDVLLLTVAAAAREAVAAAAGLRGSRDVLGGGVVRRIGIGLVAGRLIRRARARAAQLVTQDRHRRVRVDGLLGRLRVRIGILLRLADLDDVLLLTVAAAARDAVAGAGGLGRGRVLIGRALVRRIRVGLVAGVLQLRARAGARVAADRQNRRVRVHGVLLGLRVRIGVLLRLADLDHVLLLAIAATARRAGAAATGLRRFRVLVGRALVRRIGIGLVVGRLAGRARPCVHVVSGDIDGNVGVHDVLLCVRICVGVLLRLRRLVDVLLLTVATAAGEAAAAAAGLRGGRVLRGLAVVVSGGVGGVLGRLVGRARSAGHAPT